MAPQTGFGIEPSDGVSRSDGESAVWIRAENSERSEMFEASMDRAVEPAL
jgi:hypothetical protein